MSKRKMPNKMKEWRKNGEGRSSRVTGSQWRNVATYPLLEALMKRVSNV